MEKINFGESVPGYIGGPKGRPAVIVLQEWWGVTEEIKRQALRISKEGNYRVLIPDLYKGKLGVTAEESHHMMENLDWPNAVKEIVQAEKHLQSEGSSKVAAVGFCMGGALSLLAAEHGSIAGAISFYGTPDPKLSHPEQIEVLVQCHSGSNDAMKGFSDPVAVKSWCDRLPNKNYEFYEYPGEGHAFMNASPDIKKLMEGAKIPTDINKESQDKGWERVFAFFKKVLA